MICCEDDVPERWRGYVPVNAEFFDGIGSPGNATAPAPARGGSQ